MTEQQADDLQRKVVADLRKLIGTINLGMLAFLDKIDQKSTTPAASIEAEYGRPFSKLERPPGYTWGLAWPPGGTNDPEFRVPKNGETFLRSRNDRSDHHLNQHPVGVACPSSSGDPDPGTPRLILIQCKRLVFDIIGENRAPEDGEWAQWGDGAPVYPYHTLATGAKWRCILSAPRIEE